MCGIVGAVGPLPNRREKVLQLVGSLHHRGPDDQGEFHDERCTLAMRRLSIIDLAGGHQPLFNEARNVACICNGELYNFAAIRRELELAGHAFSTHSDVEVAVHGYEAWGRDVLPKLNGMFGLALWDARREELVLARDRVGKKPLYYACIAGGLIFASELRTLLAWPGQQWTVDREACRVFCLLGYVPGDRTPIAEIRRLPPGHVGVWSRDGYHQHRYWRPTPTAPHDDITATTGTLHELLRDAVRLRLISEVPIGAFLSGGLDSSLIVAIAAGELGARIPTFSITFPGYADHDEGAFARRVAQHFACEHHEIPVDFASFDDPEAFIWALDEPLADPAALPTLLLSQAARRVVKVVLTGEGADEVFGGYDRYRLSLTGSALLARQPWLRSVGSWLLKRRGMRSQDDSKISRTLRAAVEGGTSALAWSQSVSRAPAAHAKAVWRGIDRSRALEGSVASARLLPLQLDDLEGSLPNDLLTKVDRMSMAASLEARCPFLDHRVVDLGLGLPDSWKIRGGTSKIILRAIAAGVIPSEIRERPKHTFRVPTGTWLRGALKPLLEAILASDQLHRFGILEPESIAPLVRDHLSQRADYGRTLWILVTLHHWLRQAERHATLVPEA